MKYGLQSLPWSWIIWFIFRFTFASYWLYFHALSYLYLVLLSGILIFSWLIRFFQFLFTGWSFSLYFFSIRLFSPSSLLATPINYNAIWYISIFAFGAQMPGTAENSFLSSPADLERSQREIDAHFSTSSHCYQSPFPFTPRPMDCHCLHWRRWVCFPWWFWTSYHLQIHCQNVLLQVQWIGIGDVTVAIVANGENSTSFWLLNCLPQIIDNNFGNVISARAPSIKVDEVVRPKTSDKVKLWKSGSGLILEI